jgi:hypothetical protein
MDIDLDENENGRKPVVKRYRLSLKDKVKLLNSYPDTLRALALKCKRPEASISKKDVFTVIHKASGVPYGTVSKIFHHEQILRKLNVDKFQRRRFTFGSGRKPRFPRTEKRLFEEVKSRRLKSLMVSSVWLLEEYKKFAKTEDKDLAEKTKFGKDIFFSFLQRNRLARRKPSNVKPMTLPESQRLMRGFLKYFLSILDGSVPVSIGKTNHLDPVYGRFPLDCRLDKDEVGGYFGDPGSSTISLLGEGSTKVLMPKYWGTRLCTMIVFLTALQMVKKMGLVFRGAGKRVSKEETEYYATLPFVKVFFQSKAWVDSTIELEVVKTMIVPHVKEVRESYEARGALFPGVVCVEDNFSAHVTPYYWFSSLHPFSKA